MDERQIMNSNKCHNFIIYEKNVQFIWRITHHFLCSYLVIFKCVGNVDESN